MTFDRDRHTPFEELISASLHGDLTADERRRLDAHLDTCATCRATLAAFSDQRRIMSGLRHVPIPRDLGARVRAGIEHDTAARPWWKRPPAIFAGVGGGLAVIAGALLALVLLNGNPDNQDVGQFSPSPNSSAVTSATPIPTLAPLQTPAATEPPASVAPSASEAATPTASPVEASPEPDGYLAVTGPADNQVMTVVDVASDTPVAEAPAAIPVAAELSPDGQWVAYIVEIGLSGNTEIRATRIAEGIPSDEPDALPPIESPVTVGETITLAESVGGSPFVEHLFWSPNSLYLAFTVVDREGGGTDVWIFEPSTGSATPATDVGNAYAGSWVPGGASGTSLLWISTADETPESHLWMIHDSAGEITATDPADGPYPSAVNVFQPILSPNGSLVIYWTGHMDRREGAMEWGFVEGGAPWLAVNQQAGDRGYEFEDNRYLFSDLSIGRSAFNWAAIRWSPDSDAFAVWDAAWEGVSQGAGSLYPDPARVYLARATRPGHITSDTALDSGDLPEDATVVDVKIAGTGRHLAITARRPTPGDLSPVQSELLLITRNLGDVADVVEPLARNDEGWYGPAFYSQADWAELIGE